jgi:hypothetical protein
VFKCGRSMSNELVIDTAPRLPDFVTAAGERAGVRSL